MGTLAFFSSVFRIVHTALSLRSETALMEFSHFLYLGFFNPEQGPLTEERALDLLMLGDFFGSQSICTVGVRIFTHLSGERYMRFPETAAEILLPQIKQAFDIAQKRNLGDFFGKVRTYCWVGVFCGVVTLRNKLVFVRLGVGCRRKARGTLRRGHGGLCR